MRGLNLLYRGSNRTTDVLSFPQIVSQKRAALRYGALQASLGDIVINLHQAKRQAEEYGATVFEEVKRLLIHGILHLLGYEHEKGGYAARKMRVTESALFEKVR